MSAMPIAEIRIGQRHRREFGDIASLARSIDEFGLLHPVVVTPDGRLIAGERRLCAAKQLGWADVPVTVVNLDAVIRGELAENAERKDFLPSEIDAIRRTLEPLEKEAARARMQEGARAGKLSTPSDAGKARDHIGAFAGVSGRTVAKIAKVVEAAEAEPELYGPLLAAMDRTGRVDGPFKRLQVLRKAAQIRAAPPPLPGGPYQVIVADPPWPYEQRALDLTHRAAGPYPGMAIEDICKLDVRGIAADDAILWLWTTNYHMRDAFTVAESWGFEHRTILTWAKDQIGFGDWLRNQTEHVIFAVRGKPIVTLTNQSTLLAAPRGAHSAKPEAFFQLVEQLCPAPRYVELFSRQQRAGWDCWGDEVLPDAWLEQDAIGSYYAGIAEIAKRVHAGEPVPAFLLPKRDGDSP